MQALVVSAMPGGGLAYAARALPGGRASLMELARLSESPKVKEIVAEWDKLTPTRRGKTRLEVLCDSFGLSPGEFLGAVVKAAFEHNTDISKLILAVNTPRIVQKSVQQALKQKGFKDREMLMQAAGIAPKGGGIHVTAQAVAASKSQAGSQERGLPPFEQDAVLISEAVRGDRE